MQAATLSRRPRSLAAMLLLAAAGWLGGGGPGCSSSGGSGTGGDPVAPPDQRQFVALGNSPSRGPGDAPVVIVEFADFQCPYCARMAPVLEETMVSFAGKLRLVFKQYPLDSHAQARAAAEASLAAHAQGRFWPYHDLLFANPGALARPDLERYAAEVGLDLQAFAAALDRGTYQAAVDADIVEAMALRVRATPTVFINGRAAVGLLSYETLAAAIEEELLLAGSQ